MLADRAQHDHAHALVEVERLEGGAELVALPHGDDVERRAVEDDVGALLALVDLDAEAVEIVEEVRGRPQRAGRHWAVSIELDERGCSCSRSYCPLTRRRLKILPT